MRDFLWLCSVLGAEFLRIQLRRCVPSLFKKMKGIPSGEYPELRARSADAWNRFERLRIGVSAETRLHWSKDAGSLSRPQSHEVAWRAATGSGAAAHAGAHQGRAT